MDDEKEVHSKLSTNSPSKPEDKLKKEEDNKKHTIGEKDPASELNTRITNENIQQNLKPNPPQKEETHSKVQEVIDPNKDKSEINISLPDSLSNLTITESINLNESKKLEKSNYSEINLNGTYEK